MGSMPPGMPHGIPCFPVSLGRTVFFKTGCATLVFGSCLDPVCSTNFYQGDLELPRHGNVPMASLASTIAVALSKSKIKTVDEFARAAESAPGFVAISSSETRGSESRRNTCTPRLAR